MSKSGGCCRNWRCRTCGETHVSYEKCSCERSKRVKVTSEMCKQEIVSWCQLHEYDIRVQFSPVLTHDQYLEILDASKWKRISRENMGESILRIFDCRVFDDQLRAHVWERNDAISTIVVRGE